jgi:hypothetical protein
MKKTLALIPAAAAIAGSVMLVHSTGVFATPKTTTSPKQTVKEVQSTDGDSLRYVSLTAADYAEVAGELGISVACIRAVVDIEAGNKGEGFNADHTPLINFDLTMFRQAARRRGVNLEKYKSSHAVVFAAPNIRKYGSQQAAQYARLRSAMTIDSIAAMEGTFWGMFQIGGFNWRQCGCSSVGEFVRLMSYSEREQLELFAAFITKAGMVPYLKKLQWAEFARRYNGPGYRRHSYDTRMAAAYRKYSTK